MLGPMDEFPVHQIPQPIAWPGSSDRNFYDRSYFNAHDRTGDIFVISGIGYYPNLGVKDAFLLVRRGDVQTAVHLSGAIDQDRLNQHVGNYRVEVDRAAAQTAHRPRRNRGHCSRSHVGRPVRRRTGTAAHHAARATGSRSTRSVLLSSVRGAGHCRSTARRLRSIPRAGSAAATGRGVSGQSVRPSPPAAPTTRRSKGCGGCTCRWRSTTSAIVIIIQEDPHGFRSLNDCTRIWKDGRVEQLGWPRVKIHYRSGTRIPTGATIDATDVRRRVPAF